MNDGRTRPGGSSPNILVVEDEASLAMLLTYNLEAAGFQVHREERGDDAELRLSEVLPDLVILDWMLPGISGLELCRRLRARDNTKTLPVIMLTARGEESERVRGLSVGADDYVVKAILCPRIDGAGPGTLAAGQTGKGYVKIVARRSGSGPGNSQGFSRHPGNPLGANRISPVGIFDGKTRPGVLARSIAGYDLGHER